ncbi:sugar nucleotide-binding protein [Psychroflexus tropicus]|uniref:sugar nucleotide-binding protein n=1 Tax=Psychroflexus tropicus TaxID=197345 RepID=UPI0003A70286|nr:sugar nucleotide-binding protein [Psychroflexus tropicus]
MILGASGFLGSALIKELSPYYDVYGTYARDNATLESNKRMFQWNAETETLSLLLDELAPDLIISAIRGDFTAQTHVHFEIIAYLIKFQKKLIFISSANVFDVFTNYPSYEYDKTLSESVYGRFKIRIENALLRLPNPLYTIVRLPMIYGHNSPRVKELKLQHELKEPIEVFPNVVINATTQDKFAQQIHYIINRELNGVYHLGSQNLIHHKELIYDILKGLELEQPIFKNVYNSNEDRYIAVIPKENILPKNLQITIEEVVADSVKLS